MQAGYLWCALALSWATKIAGKRLDMMAGREASDSDGTDDGVPCADDDQKLVLLAQKKFNVDVSGCGDAQVTPMCSHPKFGKRIRSLCCLSCSECALDPNPSPLPPQASGAPAMDLPPADDARPLHLYWMGGQSECKGAARTKEFKKNQAPSGFNYSALTGVQQDVWLAGLAGQGLEEMDSFFISKMQPGIGQNADNSKRKFGPELSFGQRIHELTGARVMVIKYARGGSSVMRDWNPDDCQNTWNYSADDGSASWLYATGNVPAKTKAGLFKTHTYLVRRTLEALDTAGVKYVWKGIVWSQGQSDAGNSVQKVGRDTAALFTAIRQRVVHDSGLPIVDNGASAKHKLMSGKQLAVASVGNAVNVEGAIATQNHMDPCVSTPKNACSNSTFLNVDFMNFYGWDVGIPKDLKPETANHKKSAWFIDFGGNPPNLHSEYEAMIRNGWMFANAFVLNFVPGGASLVTASMRAEDPAISFPWRECIGAERPSPSNHCWVNCMDHPDVCAIWPELELS